MKSRGTASFLTRDIFLHHVKDRLSKGETRVQIGSSLGVSGMAVTRWLQGRSGVSATILLLAELQMRTPQRLTCSEWPAGIE